MATARRARDCGRNGAAGCGLVTAALALALSAPLAAQSIDVWRVRIYAVNGVTPVTTFEIQRTGMICGQPKPTPVAINPTKVYVQDPADTTTYCVWQEGPIGPLSELPLGAYQGTLAAVVGANLSAETARVNFVKEADGEEIPVPGDFGFAR